MECRQITRRHSKTIVEFSIGIIGLLGILLSLHTADLQKDVNLQTREATSQRAMVYYSADFNWIDLFY